MDSFGPWKRRSVSPRYDNAWIRVEHHDVVTPGGSPGIYGVVHFKNLAIGIIPLDDNQETWIVGQYRYPHREYSWEIPDRWDRILEMDLSNSVTDERCIIFLARDLEVHSSHPEDTEELTVRRIPFRELHRGVVEGQYRDSLTVAGVLKLDYLLSNALI
jgi:hypothetical protein